MKGMGRLPGRAPVVAEEGRLSRVTVSFPDGFLWGCATSAYQIEGAVAEGGRGRSIWDTFSHTPGKTIHGDTGDIADDHYHRLEADLDLMAGIGLQAYRFSVAWPRIQPDGAGPPNQPGLDHYRRLVEGLKRRGIAPCLTLYHWDLPQALQDEGGWTVRDTAERFGDYAAILGDALGEDVTFWITHNEPWVAAWMGYGTGAHAPGIADEAAALSASHHLLLSHGRALEALRASAAAGAEQGITLNLAPVRPASEDPADQDAARRVDGNQNRLFLDPLLKREYPSDMVTLYETTTDWSFVRDGDLGVIGADLDFMGVNYYMRHRVAADEADPERGSVILVPAEPTTAMGWGIDPEGLTDLLVRLDNDYPNVPLYVTENGAAFNDYVDPEGGVDDIERVAFLDAHFRAAHAAIERGVDLRGYFVWSLLDNFEWALGYSKRFGIVFVEYGTQRRIPKQSAAWFRAVIERNGLA